MAKVCFGLTLLSHYLWPAGKIITLYNEEASSLMQVRNLIKPFTRRLLSKFSAISPKPSQCLEGFCFFLIFSPDKHVLHVHPAAICFFLYERFSRFIHRFLKVF